VQRYGGVADVGARLAPLCPAAADGGVAGGKITAGGKLTTGGKTTAGSKFPP